MFVLYDFYKPFIHFIFLSNILPSLHLTLTSTIQARNVGGWRADTQLTLTGFDPNTLVRVGGQSKNPTEKSKRRFAKPAVKTLPPPPGATVQGDRPGEVPSPVVVRIINPFLA